MSWDPTTGRWAYEYRRIKPKTLIVAILITLTISVVLAMVTFGPLLVDSHVTPTPTPTPRPTPSFEATVVPLPDPTYGSEPCPENPPAVEGMEDYGVFPICIGEYHYDDGSYLPTWRHASGTRITVVQISESSWEATMDKSKLTAESDPNTAVWINDDAAVCIEIDDPYEGKSQCVFERVDAGYYWILHGSDGVTFDELVAAAQVLADRNIS